jgi:hypothetical protein
MKLIINTLFLFFSVTLCGQGNNDTLQSYGKKISEEVENILREYDRVQISQDIFIYRKNNRDAYSLHLRKKYDSLLRNTRQKDSVILAKSILRLKYRHHIYIRYQPDLFDETYKLNKYDENNKLLEVITYSSKYKTIGIDNFTNKTSFIYSNNLSYTFSKYKSINKNNNFDNPLYIIILDKDGKILERNYEKDFPVSKEEILKQFPENFFKQASNLTKGKKYSYDQKDWSRELSEKNAKLESEEFKLLISKNKVRLDKLYDENNIPFYEIIFVSDSRKYWSLKINPKTGDIYQIDFSILKE